MLRRCEACEEWTSLPFVEVYPDHTRKRDSASDGHPLSVCANCVVGHCVPAFRPSQSKWNFGRVVAYSHPFFAVFFDDALRPEWIELDPRPMESYLKIHSQATQASASPDDAYAKRRDSRETPSPSHYHQHRSNPFHWWTRAPPVTPYEPDWHSPYSIDGRMESPLPEHLDDLLALEEREISINDSVGFEERRRHLNDSDLEGSPTRENSPRAATNNKHDRDSDLEGSPTRENSPRVANNKLTHKSSPRLWTPEEDRILLRAVESIQGTTVPFHAASIRWPDVAKLVPHRTGKQCRERYFNHLASTVSAAKAWTPVEDATVCRLYGQVGSRWAFISKFLPGRSDNNVKNRFHYLRRQLDKQEAMPAPEFDNDEPGALMYDVSRHFDQIRESVDATFRSNDGLAVSVEDLLVRMLRTGQRLLSPRDVYSGFFGPFEAPRSSSEPCSRCGFTVPSAQTGSEVCSKTRWCVECSMTTVFLSDAALRVEHQLRSTASAPAGPGSH